MKVCLDRFSQGRPDPQEERPVAECHICGFELYEGDTYFLKGDKISCADIDCLGELAGAERRTA